MTYSLYSSNWQEREWAKDEHEARGAQAFHAGKEKWQNPFISIKEAELAQEFPDCPIVSDDNLSAYYWEIGWENAEAGEPIV
jgi:hypothetical protein